MIKNILIAGLPKSGKSTLLGKVVQNFPHKVGFITKEITNKKIRTGFEIENHLSRKVTLASIDFKTSHKVSKYYVNIKNLNSIIKETQVFLKEDILYLDEIGEMELFSLEFKKILLKFLNSENIFIGTITKAYTDGFIENIKKRDDIFIVELSGKNGEDKTEFIIQLISKIKKAKEYINEPSRFIRKGLVMEFKSEHGKRKLSLNNGVLICNCDFFKNNEICSHVVAASELIKR